MPATLYAGTYGGVFKSTDFGGTWAAANAGLTNLNVNALAIDPTTPATLYTGTYGGVFKSTDFGATWAAANAGLTSLSVATLALDPRSPATLFAGTSGGVFKSTNSGGTWTATNAGLTNLNISALALDPIGTTILYAGIAAGSVWQLRGSADFHTVVPCRVFDTRDVPLGGPLAIAAGATVRVPVASHCGIPPTALAVAINLTMTAASGPGDLTLFPDGTSRPLGSAINYAAGQTRATGAVTSLGSSGALAVFVGQSVGSVHVIVDVNGYFR